MKPGEETDQQRAIRELNELVDELVEKYELDMGAVRAPSGLEILRRIYSVGPAVLASNTKKSET